MPYQVRVRDGFAYRCTFAPVDHLAARETITLTEHFIVIIRHAASPHSASKVKMHFQTFSGKTVSILALVAAYASAPLPASAATVIGPSEQPQISMSGSDAMDCNRAVQGLPAVTQQQVPCKDPVQEKAWSDARQRRSEQALRDKRLREQRLRAERLQAQQLRDERIHEERIRDERVHDERVHEERLREERVHEQRLRDARSH